MTDHVELLKSFGNALIKLLIGLSVGAGVGLLTLGLVAYNEPDPWQSPMIHQQPPLVHLFLGIGAGLLALTVMLVLLFFGPWVKKRQPPAGSQNKDRAADRKGLA